MESDLPHKLLRIQEPLIHPVPATFIFSLSSPGAEGLHTWTNPSIKTKHEILTKM